LLQKKTRAGICSVVERSLKVVKIVKCKLLESEREREWEWVLSKKRWPVKEQRECHFATYGVYMFQLHWAEFIISSLF
jgi:hypothetical protein